MLFGVRASMSGIESAAKGISALSPNPGLGR